MSNINKDKKDVGKTLAVIETGLQIAGTFIPFVAIAGVGVGLFNKKYAKQNMEHFAKRLEQIEVKINTLNEQQERNLTLRVVDITNKVIKERNLKKIDLFANAIKTGILKNTVFQDDEGIDKILDVLDRLHLDDIEFLEQFYERTKIVFDNGKEGFNYLAPDDFVDLWFVNNNEPEPTNGTFNKGALLRLQKAIANGLIVEKIKERKEVIGGKLLNRSTLLEQFEHEISYELSDFYFTIREYILHNEEIG